MNKKKQFSKVFLIFLENFYFYFNQNKNHKANVLINPAFHYTIKKKLLKLFSYKKYLILSNPWQSYSFIKFIEHCSGSKILFRFFLYLNLILSFKEQATCLSWISKLRTFQKFIGPGFYLYESIHIIFICLKLKDPFLLINWMAKTLHRISFWKLRALFYYLRYLFKYFFWEVLEELKIKGIMFKLKGKISVSGNARTRKIIYKTGKVSFSSFDNKILYSHELIYTFTGVMSLQIWLVF